MKAQVDWTLNQFEEEFWEFRGKEKSMIIG